MKRWFANSTAHFGIFGANSLSKIAFGFIVRYREGPHGLVLNLSIFDYDHNFQGPTFRLLGFVILNLFCPNKPNSMYTEERIHTMGSRNLKAQYIYIYMTILKTSLGFMEDFPLYMDIANSTHEFYPKIWA